MVSLMIASLTPGGGVFFTLQLLGLAASRLHPLRPNLTIF